MKKMIFLLLATSLPGLFSKGQAQTCQEWLVLVNPATGSFTCIDSIKQDCWVMQGSQFFNSYTHRYQFQGKRGTGGNRFYTLQPGAGANPIYDSLTPAIANCNFLGGASDDLLNRNYTLGIVTNTAGIVTQLSVDSIDPATSAITPVLPIAALTGTNIAISQFIYDALHNSFFVYYADPSGGFKLSVIDGTNGGVLNTFSTSVYIFNLQYDPVSGKLYGVQSNGSTYDLMSFDPTNGSLATVSNVTGLAGNFVGATLYKAHGWYSFLGIDGTGHPHLYTLDINTGAILYNISTPSFATAACTPPAAMGLGGSTNGNMLMPAYDQSNGMLYCLHWGILPQDIVTATSHELKAVQWKAYPNPSASLVYIEGNDGVEYAVELTDISGRSLCSGKNNREINLEGLALGIYQLKITSSQGVSMIKLVRSDD